MNELAKSMMLPEADYDEVFRQWELITGVDVDGLKRLITDTSALTMGSLGELMRCCRIERCGVVEEGFMHHVVVIQQEVSVHVLDVIEAVIDWKRMACSSIEIRVEKGVKNE